MQVVDKALESLIWEPTPSTTRQKNVLQFGFRKVHRSAQKLPGIFYLREDEHETFLEELIYLPEVA